MKGHEKKVTSIIFNNNGKILASGSYDAIIKIWNIENLTEIKSFNYCDVNSIAFNKTGTRLAIGMMDTTIVLWDIEINKYTNFFGHKNYILSV